MSHTRGPLVAFNGKVSASITGFEVCTVMRTDKNHHPELLAVAKRYEDALLYAAAPDLLAALERMSDFGFHKGGCSMIDADSDEGKTCDCGFYDAIEIGRAAVAKAKK